MKYNVQVDSNKSISVQYAKPRESTVQDDLLTTMIIIKSIYEAIDEPLERKFFMDSLQKYVDSGFIDKIESEKKA